MINFGYIQLLIFNFHSPNFICYIVGIANGQDRNVQKHEQIELEFINNSEPNECKFFFCSLFQFSPLLLLRQKICEHQQAAAAEVKNSYSFSYRIVSFGRNSGAYLFSKREEHANMKEGKKVYEFFNRNFCSILQSSTHL